MSREDGIGVLEQLCAFMEVNGIRYLESRQRRGDFEIQTVISKDLIEENTDSADEQEEIEEEIEEA